MKKEVFDIIKNGCDFKLIRTYDSNENIISIIEKPNIKFTNPNLSTSGAHVFPSRPEQNHIDFFSGALVIKKEYSQNGETYGYNISGGLLI